MNPSDFGIGTTRGRTVIHLAKEQYRMIAAHIVGMEDPENHEGTVALFAKLHRACGFPKLLKAREAYPDIVAVDESGHEARIEVEFESANFEREHMNEAAAIPPFRALRGDRLALPATFLTETYIV